jgi:cytochrome c oxidase cbb3-type subunit 3
LPSQNRLVRCLIFVVILVAGCDPDLPGKPNPKDRPIPAEQVLAFEVLYGRNCAGCHGKDGSQGPAPPLNDPLFRAIVPESELKMVLDQGRRGTAMAPFAHDNGGSLSAAQVQVLISEIKGERYRIVEKRADGQVKDEVADDGVIAPRWGAVEPAPAGVPPYLQQELSGNEEQGAKLFARACASCHGHNGEGVIRDGKRRKKINDRTFLALISDQALRRIIITGRADLMMPNYSQKTGRPDDFQPLTSADVADLVALLASWRKGKSISEN